MIIIKTQEYNDDLIVTTMSMIFKDAQETQTGK